MNCPRIKLINGVYICQKACSTGEVQNPKTNINSLTFECLATCPSTGQKFYFSNNNTCWTGCGSNLFFQKIFTDTSNTTVKGLQCISACQSTINIAYAK